LVKLLEFAGLSVGSKLGLSCSLLNTFLFFPTPPLEFDLDLLFSIFGSVFLLDFKIPAFEFQIEEMDFSFLELEKDFEIELMKDFVGWLS